MRKLLPALVAIGLAFGSPGAARSDQTVEPDTATWQVVPAPTDGPPFPAAAIANADGYTLYLWSRTDERGRQVFAELHAPEDARFIGRMPTWRIDDEPAIDAADVREAGDAMGLLWGFTVDHVSIWMIWLGQGDVPADDPAHDWFVGEALSVTIRMANGEDRTIAFPLTGARAAIEEAVELKPMQTADGS